MKTSEQIKTQMSTAESRLAEVRARVVAGEASRKDLEDAQWTVTELSLKLEAAEKVEREEAEAKAAAERRALADERAALRSDIGTAHSRSEALGKSIAPLVIEFEARIHDLITAHATKVQSDHARAHRIDQQLDGKAGDLHPFEAEYRARSATIMAARIELDALLNSQDQACRDRFRPRNGGEGLLAGLATPHRPMPPLK